jgi:hypothetical protein
MPYYIEVVSKLGKKIRVTKKYWEYIITKHESVKSLEEAVKGTLKNPETVRASKEDPDIYLYYSRYGRYYLCVVCKHLNNEGFIITAYLADKIKKGRKVL